MAEYAEEGVYVNFVADPSAERASRPASGPDSRSTGRDQAGQYDPENVFRNNPNIPPSGTCSSAAAGSAWPQRRRRHTTFPVARRSSSSRSASGAVAPAGCTEPTRGRRAPVLSAWPSRAIGVAEAVWVGGEHAERAAADVDVREQQPVDPDLRDLTRGEADHDDATFGLQRSQALLEALGAAHRVDDQLDRPRQLRSKSSPTDYLVGSRRRATSAFSSVDTTR